LGDHGGVVLGRRVFGQGRDGVRRMQDDVTSQEVVMKGKSLCRTERFGGVEI
jgi:hypothetical protein